MGNKTCTGSLGSVWMLGGRYARQATKIICYGDRACLGDKMNESKGFLRNPTYILYLVYALPSCERRGLGSPEQCRHFEMCECH